MDYQKTAEQILDNVGGKQNVSNLTHCFTRLRLIVRDKNKVNKNAISRIEGVIQVLEASGQLQIVLGNKVEKVYDAIMPLIGNLDSKVSPTENNEKIGWGTKMLNIIAAIFTPTIPAIAASGMLKGILAVAVLIYSKIYGIDIKTFNTYIILNAASDALFYFMPIILARSAAKVFKTNDYIAMIIGATLCYPAIVTLMTGTSPVTLFGIGITKANYTSSVIPIIIAVFILSYIERFITKIMPDVLKIIMVPTISLLIMIPSTLIIFGPIGIYLGDFVNWLYYYIMHLSPILLGAFIGGIWCILVIFGAHRAIIPIGINDVAKTGHQNLLSFAGAANFSQAGAALGVFFKTKNKNLKTVSVSAVVTALFGITEPAIYGVNLRLKKPMISAVICGALAGGIMGWGGSFGNAFANQGILTIPVYASSGVKGFTCYLIGICIAFFGSCILTMILGFDDLVDDNENSTNIEKNKVDDDVTKADSDLLVLSPLSGKIIPLEQVKDEVFSSGTMGKGIAIEPSEGKIVAPMDCKVDVIYPTLHAIGLTLENGVEMLVHIGVNTIELNGKYFEKCANVDECLKKGTPIVKFNDKKIKTAGFDTTTSVIITNSKEFAAIGVTNKKIVKENEDLLFIKKKEKN